MIRLNKELKYHNKIKIKYCIPFIRLTKSIKIFCRTFGSTLVYELRMLINLKLFFILSVNPVK